VCGVHRRDHRCEYGALHQTFRGRPWLTRRRSLAASAAALTSPTPVSPRRARCVQDSRPFEQMPRTSAAQAQPRGLASAWHSSPSGSQPRRDAAHTVIYLRSTSSISSSALRWGCRFNASAWIVSKENSATKQRTSSSVALRVTSRDRTRSPLRRWRTSQKASRERGPRVLPRRASTGAARHKRVRGCPLR
jgi:hypothetical protein